jgi:Flp pilus assembly protein TadD
MADEVNPSAEPVLGLLTLAWALRIAGDEAIAERLLRRAVDARPQEVALLGELGRLLEDQKQWGKAAECYRAARSLRPELGVTLANALVEGGQVDDGVALFARLLVEQPDNPIVHFTLGYALYKQSRFKEAEAEYREAIRLWPDFPEAHITLGIALESQRRFKEAEAEFREAIRLRPVNPTAHANLGVALGRQGRFKEAEAEFREAIRLRPVNPTAHANLGLALSEQGRFKEAEYREAIRLWPDFARGAQQPRCRPGQTGPFQGGGGGVPRGHPPLAR